MIEPERLVHAGEEIAACDITRAEIITSGLGERGPMDGREAAVIVVPILISANGKQRILIRTHRRWNIVIYCIAGWIAHGIGERHIAENILGNLVETRLWDDVAREELPIFFGVDSLGIVDLYGISLQLSIDSLGMNDWLKSPVRSRAVGMEIGAVPNGLILRVSSKATKKNVFFRPS